MTRRVAVIGGGIGGLTAALALLRSGIDVDVYEQAPQLSEVGAGIQLSSNGTRVLFELGLEPALNEVKVAPARRVLRHWRTGETWDWMELGAGSRERYGTPHLSLHRGDLHSVLIDAVQSIKSDTIKLSQRAIGIENQEDFVEVRFESGQRTRAPFVIGADGIHSQIRAEMFGPSKPTFTGVVAWRGLISMDALPDHLRAFQGTNWLGPQGHVLHYPVRRGEIMNFISFVERVDWQIESWKTQGTMDELANDFRGWHQDVQAMITSIDTPFKWALMVRGPMKTWSVGRTTLLGDACHPTLPFLGQGGVMAIEDAYVIARSLARYFDDPSRAFARYEEIRRDRTSAVVQKSHENRALAFSPALENPDNIGIEVARKWQLDLARTREDWIYSYDATSVAV